MKEKEKKELALSKILLLVFAVIGLLFIIWFAWIRPAQESANITSFDECEAAGYPIQLSFPPACVTPNGQRFTDN